MRQPSLPALEPPNYEEFTNSDAPRRPTDKRTSTAVHPRVAVLLGINHRWHAPLLLCRALSTGPALWWGLRCSITFLAELLLSDGTDAFLYGEAWTVEKRFKVTEVFLAIVWVYKTGLVTSCHLVTADIVYRIGVLIILLC